MHQDIINCKEKKATLHHKTIWIKHQLASRALGGCMVYTMGGWDIANFIATGKSQFLIEIAIRWQIM